MAGIWEQAQWAKRAGRPNQGLFEEIFTWPEKGIEVPELEGKSRVRMQDIWRDGLFPNPAKQESMIGWLSPGTAKWKVILVPSEPGKNGARARGKWGDVKLPKHWDGLGKAWMVAPKMGHLIVGGVEPEASLIEIHPTIWGCRWAPGDSPPLPALTAGVDMEVVRGEAEYLGILAIKGELLAAIGKDARVWGWVKVDNTQQAEKLLTTDRRLALAGFWADTWEGLELDIRGAETSADWGWL